MGLFWWAAYESSLPTWCTVVAIRMVALLTDSGKTENWVAAQGEARVMLNERDCTDKEQQGRKRGEAHGSGA